MTRRPDWLGTRVLPKRDDGFGEPVPTPPLLRNRRFATIDYLPPPKGRHWAVEISPVPRKVAERSTWKPKCPVALDELAYIKMTFWGFDHLPHTGELMVNAAWAEEIAHVFEILYKERFPIEEMRVPTKHDLRPGRPTGDGNITSSFECRPVTGGSGWSQHAYGLAIDINPFHNPYLIDDLVVPELAGAYTNRAWVRPGMIVDGDAATRAFAAIGWGWGGHWSSLKDWMHFSSTSR